MRGGQRRNSAANWFRATNYFGLSSEMGHSIIRDVQSSAVHDTAQVAVFRVEPYPVTVS